ncbi:hypothetical protein SLA2020_381390 [Shorea laevis]
MSPRKPPTAYSTTSRNLRALLTPFWEMKALFPSLEDSVKARSSAMHTIFSTASFCQATLYFPTIITRESPFLLSTTLNTNHPAGTESSKSLDSTKNQLKKSIYPYTNPA